jgi:hypothetical protein
MKVVALTSSVFDGNNTFHTVGEVFEVTDERGSFLLTIGAVEKFDDTPNRPVNYKPEAKLHEGEHVIPKDDVPKVVKRGPGRPRKTAE